MKYVIDNNTLISIFKHYFFGRFPTFWNNFNNLINSNEICSVKEVYNELKKLNRGDELEKWYKNHRGFFIEPSIEDMKFVSMIFSIQHFQNNLEKKKLANGGAYADPFIIAKAYNDNLTVITQESYKPNAAKIPNICKHFKIKYVNLEGFLETENWIF
jgi:hypothetical protein